MLPLRRWKGYGGLTAHNGSNFETLTWTTGILASTRHIMAFGTVPVSLFNPVVADKQMVTAELIGKGRFDLNVVCCRNRDEFDMFGASLVQHEERYDQGQGWVDIIKHVWFRTEPFNYHGKFYQVHKTNVNPQPHGEGGGRRIRGSLPDCFWQDGIPSIERPRGCHEVIPQLIWQR